jgi:hypothetical protein
MKLFISLTFALMTAFVALAQDRQSDLHIRVNQAGYQRTDKKIAIVLTNAPLLGTFSVKKAGNGQAVFSSPVKAGLAPAWGEPFSHAFEFDFTAVKETGRFYLESGTAKSAEFTIGDYPGYHEDLLFFMRQQRCGYNPFLDAVCHKRDGRSFYAPFADETYVDASGGWHDAGDQLKYLITASNATAQNSVLNMGMSSSGRHHSGVFRICRPNLLLRRNTWRPGD